MASHNFVDENEYAERLIPRESAPELKADVRAAAEYPLREGQPNRGMSENLSGFRHALSNKLPREPAVTRDAHAHVRESRSRKVLPSGRHGCGTRVVARESDLVP